MTQLILERPPTIPGGECGDERPGTVGGASKRAEMGGEPSLDTLLSGMWEGLAAHRPTACPLCGGDMAPFYGVHARPVGARCRSCATELT